MAIVTFDRAVRFPIGPMHKLLDKHLPLYKWQCGEDDTGAEDQWAAFQPHQIIAGRSNATTIFAELHAHQELLTVPAPPHRGYFRIDRPTTDMETIADRIMVVMAWSLICLDPDNGACQLLPGGNWLTTEDLKRATRLILEGEPLAVAAGLGRPLDSFATKAQAAAPNADASTALKAALGKLADLPHPELHPRRRSAMLGVDTLGLAATERSFAKQLHQRFGEEFATMCGHKKPPAYLDEGVREDRLPTLIVLLDRPLGINWPLIEEAVGVLDPEGGWSFDYDGEGNAVVAGRGGTIALEHQDKPVPAYLIENAFDRSHWFADGPERARVRAHTGQLVIGMDLNTRAAPFADVRMTAMIATLLAGMINKEGGQAGLYNAGTEALFAPDLATSQTAILGDNEIPIALWTWCAFHSTRDDAISASTAGLLPFVGYEVELWNAPGTLQQAMGQANNAMRYLLLKGPVVRDGDTMGEQQGDRSIRCFFGPSKAGRDEQVTAMFLEFDGGHGTQPKPDPAVPGRPPMGAGSEAVLRDFLKRVGGNDTTGMSDVIRGMLSENDAARAARPMPPTARPAPPPAAPERPAFGRRAGGFGRKGL